MNARNSKSENSETFKRLDDKIISGLIFVMSMAIAIANTRNTPQFIIHGHPSFSGGVN